MVKANRFLQKRFYTRRILRSKRIPRLAIIPTIYHDWLRKSVNYLTLSCIEGKGVEKAVNIVDKIPRYLLIYYKISFYLVACVVCCLLKIELTAIIFQELTQFSDTGCYQSDTIVDRYLAR